MSGMQTETTLLVTDEAEARELWADLLRRAGLEVHVAGDGSQNVEAARVDVLVVDRESSREFQGRFPDAVAIVLCETVAVEDTVELMRAGVFHVLERPVAPAQLAAVVQKALEHRRLSRGNRDLKNQLDISEKLAMIGRLASGVAHELNNPLDGVRRYVRMTQEGLEEEKQDLIEYLDRALSGLGRMASIVRQLLTFSRNVVIENESENLRTMLEEVVRTLAPTGSASPTVDLANPYLDVAAPRALFQVFVNLIKNALDAVEHHGPRGRRPRVRRARQGGRHRTSRQGQRQRHRSRQPEARLRAVFHNQGSGPGNRPGTADQRAYRRALRGHHSHRE